MANLSIVVPPSDRAAHEVLLPAGQEVRVEFAYSVTRIEVENITGTGRVYFTTDGTTPTVAGGNCLAVPATLHAVEADRPVYNNDTGTVVRLIAATATTVSVSRA